MSSIYIASEKNIIEQKKTIRSLPVLGKSWFYGKGLLPTYISHTPMSKDHTTSNSTTYVLVIPFIDAIFNPK